MFEADLVKGFSEEERPELIDFMKSRKPKGDRPDGESEDDEEATTHF